MMPTVQVSQRPGAVANNAGWPSGVNGGPIWFGFATSSVSTEIEIPGGWGSADVAVGQLVRWLAPDGVNQLRRITAVNAGTHTITVHAPIAMDDGTLYIGGDLPDIQTGLDAVAALQPTIRGPWLVDVSEGNYSGNVSIGVAGGWGEGVSYTQMNILRLHPNAVVSGGTNGISSAIGNLYWQIEGGIWENASQSGLNFASSYHVTLRNLVARNNGQRGIITTDNAHLINCESYGNGGNGIHVVGYANLFGCRSWNNALAQFAVGYYAVCVRCWGQAKASAVNQGVFLVSSGVFAAFYDCTADGLNAAGSRGFWQSATGGVHVVNCIAHRCQWGLFDNNQNFKRFHHANNLISQCTNPHYNFESDGDIVADAVFVDADNRNYRLRAGSPGVGAGLNGADIGAFQSPRPSSLEIHLVHAMLWNKRQQDLSTGVVTVFDGDGETPLVTMTPSIDGGSFAVEPTFAAPASLGDPVAYMHRIKAALLNRSETDLVTRARAVCDDDGETVLRTFTPTVTAGVEVVNGA